MKKLLLLLLLIPFTNSFGQSGYLGAMNGISVEFNAIPSYRMTKRYFQDTAANEYIMTERFRYSWFTFGLAYSRVITKNFEATASYNFTKAYAPVRDAVYRTENGNYIDFVEDPRVNIHIGSLKGRIYRKGSLAPIGKYIGFGFKFGFARWNSNDEIQTGNIGLPVSNGFLASKYEVNNPNVYEPQSHHGRFVQLNGEIGRNYPVTDFLIIGVNMTFPLIGVYTSNGRNNIGPFISNSLSTYEHDEWYRLTQLTMRKISGLSGQICVKFLI